MQGKKSVKKVVRSAAGPEPAALSLDSARAAIGSAEAALAAVRDAETGLVRRAGASAGNTRALVANMQDGLDAVAREASSDAVHVASGWCKAWEALAECEDVSAEQLCAHADGIEGAISAGDAAVVAKWHEAATLALACLARSHPPVSSWADVTVSPYAECAIGFSLWCRSRAAECVVSGPGADGFVLGDGDAINTVLLRLLDECGDGIDDVAPTDIAVSVSGGTVVGASTLESGVVEVCYSVPETRLHPVVLCVDPVAWALPMTRRSVNARCAVLEDSVVLANTSLDSKAIFLRQLTRNWLPSKGFRLLYRGSRDGMSARAFHSCCDGKGPTLMLVQTTGGYSFGGYSPITWTSPVDGPEEGGADELEDSPRPFLFTVHGRFGDGVCFPLLPGCEARAIRPMRDRGPCFGGSDLFIMCTPFRDRNDWGRIPGTFWEKAGADCMCLLGSADSCYQDVLRKGNKTFTGKSTFAANEVEVYSVVPLDVPASAH